ncbi:hypothetical protein BCR32DRAFT_329891 [Anaeromyces robustus]|uniref:Phospholipase/carboxylesterase/thioesterase domain-containing protein n=1 Tax=Anaeromyces robustus TaxID=1754192 RepID=A0A1Y1WNW0_9FUNG|nr:hypothetical protein BCR32DRAFT_329891 [Anaeromyces robustus]|eukprot:ORX75231.1 hypothetical protein BCR32DRAFT_329891 [Anaeromyces robustus]
MVIQVKTYKLDSHGTIYAYLPSYIIETKKYPLVMALCCTTGNPQAEVKTNGWDKIVKEEDIIVIAPTYNNYATYSETKYIKSVIDDAIKRYPIDTERIYSTGFSNGGALSVALVSTYPNLLAGISAMGWSIGMNNKSPNSKIPFLLIQGTNEYTQITSSGDKAIMDDEIITLKDIFYYNNMKEKDVIPDYHQYPYWGYKPHEKELIYPEYTDYDLYGNSSNKKSGIEWTLNLFFTDNYKKPLVELILVENSNHIPHDCNARLAWNFFGGFKRTETGQLKEI